MIVIVNVPGTLSKKPHAAPALLKASLENNGFKCRTLDFNIRFHNQYENNSDYNLMETYFLTGENPLPECQSIMEQYADEILDINPQWVGISVFTYQSRTATHLLCRILKNKKPDIKIVLGGQGLTQGGINGVNSFPKQLKSQGLIDYWIKSEGEISLVELLKGNITYSGIDSDQFQQIEDVDELPIPDYSDYDLDSYEEKELIVVGSRGCVRNCSFCDIHQHWKYRYRDGIRLAEEIISLSKQYSVDKFYFADSLVNGNLKQWRIFLEKISDYNRQSSNPITWCGQYIVRPAEFENDDYWRLMSTSGARELYLGIETGSDKLRLEMNKKFTNSDLDYTVQQLVKYNIKCEFLMFVGYPTETLEDYEQTLSMIKKYRHLAGSTITNINISDTLSILPGTPLYADAERLKIELDENENNWLCYDNSDLTIQERIRRTDEARAVAKQCGYEAPLHQHNLIEYLKLNANRFETRMKIKKMIKMKQVATYQ